MKAAVLLLIALAGCVSTPPSTPPPAPKTGTQITISDERMAQCKEAGGCAFMSQAEVAVAMHHAYVMGARSAHQEFVAGLDSQGCRRGNT